MSERSDYKKDKRDDSRNRDERRRDDERSDYKKDKRDDSRNRDERRRDDERSDYRKDKRDDSRNRDERRRDNEHSDYRKDKRDERDNDRKHDRDGERYKRKESDRVDDRKDRDDTPDKKEDDKQENKKQKNNSYPTQFIEQIQNMDQYQQMAYFQQNPEAYMQYMQIYNQQMEQMQQYYSEHPEEYQAYIQQYGQYEQEQYQQYQNPGFQGQEQKSNYQRGGFQNNNNGNQNQGNFQNNRGNRGRGRGGFQNNNNENYQQNTNYSSQNQGNERGRGRGNFQNRGGRGGYQNNNNENYQQRGNSNRGRGRGNDYGNEQMLSNPKRGENPQPITLITNFFKIQLPSFGVFAYHIDYDNIKDDKLSKMKALGMFKMLQTSTDLGPRPLFDGKHTLFLLKDIGESQIVLLSNKKSNPKKQGGRQQKLTLKRTNKIQLHNFDLNEESTRVLEIFIKTLFPECEKKGRGIYDPKNTRDDIPLQNSDLIIKKGVSFTFHPSESGLLLHSDITHQICIASLSIDQWILYRAQSAEIRLQNNHSDISEIFSNNRLSSFRQTLVSDLKNKRFYLTHTAPLKIKRKFETIDWKLTPRSCKFDYIDPNTKKTRSISVEEYYKIKYNIQLQHGDTWPLIIIKKTGKNEYYPLEVCKLEDGQIRNGVSANERRDVITNTKVNLENRFQNLQEKINDLSSKVSGQKDIPLVINNTFVKATGKVLPAPAIIYKNNQLVESDRGEWKQPFEAKFLQATKFDELHICYPNSIQSEDQLNPFIEKISSIMSSKLGFVPIFKSFQYNSRDRLENQAQTLCQYAKSKIKLSTFFIIVMFGKRKNAETYNCFKTKLELELGLNTQFVMEETINSSHKSSTMENIVCIINKKAKKTEQVAENWRVEDLPLMNEKEKTCFIGIDVNHGSQGSIAPSEAAISVSYGEGVTSFFSTFRSQDKCTEEVKDLKGMLIESFENISIPFQNIIVIRDGLANNQFNTIAMNELESLKLVINSHPIFEKIKNIVKIAFIIVQKRNSCKLSVEGFKIKPGFFNKKLGASKIPPPGTTLDNIITGVEKKDFYLVSQKSPQGVARPIRYIILHDELKQSLEVWEELLFKLCYLHPGCTRSISLPLPLYNAHKLAFRVGQVYRHSNQTQNLTTINIPKELKWTGFYF